MAWLICLLLSVVSFVSSSPVEAPRFACGDFKEGACDLNEYNIVGNDRHTNTPAECQVLCRSTPGCGWFTHFDTQCFLVISCETTETCSLCISGPASGPDFESCPWPPGGPTDTPTTTPTTTPPTTTTTTTTTTTKAPTTTPTTTSTTTPTTPTTTPTPTTTTKAPSDTCDDIVINEQCDWDYGLIQWFENHKTGAWCQEKCTHVGGAKYFSHYSEGAEAEWAYCGCFSTCAWPAVGNCRDRCSTHEVFSAEEDISEEVTDEDDSAETFGGEVDIPKEPRPGPGERWCHCMRGPLTPDVDTCDLWPQ